jgi:hypothetical protein
METRTIRRKRYDEHRFLQFESTSFKSGENWHNCLYLIFIKEKFSELNYPQLVDGFRDGEKVFNYFCCDLANLDWHGGITYYNEKLDLETKLTTVKVGCDFQHLWDDAYMREDCGETILSYHSDKLLIQFLEINKLRQEA